MDKLSKERREAVRKKTLVDSMAADVTVTAAKKLRAETVLALLDAYKDAELAHEEDTDVHTELEQIAHALGHKVPLGNRDVGSTLADVCALIEQRAAYRDALCVIAAQATGYVNPVDVARTALARL